MSGIVIIGGKLQGSEAAYLGRQANIKITLIDKDPYAPAQKLCDEFICGDVLSNDPRVLNALETADMILPTMENYSVLEGLVKISSEKGYTLAFDWDAYNVSASKRISDKLFADNNLPCPKYYPDGSFPYIAKPEAESGSHGVRIINDEDEMRAFLSEKRNNYIIQEFVSGPSYSMEVIGCPGNYRTYEITEIFVDEVYDCNRAATLHNITLEKKKKIEELIVNIAELIQLKGIMDIEVIDHNDDIKILEIDARLPSQTAIVVYHASGMNYIKELYDLFTYGGFIDEKINICNFASISHFMITGEKYESQGEHIMTEGGLLKYTENICSEATVVSDFCSDNKNWRGAFINWAEDYDSLCRKELLMKNEIEHVIACVNNQSCITIPSA